MSVEILLNVRISECMISVQCVQRCSLVCWQQLVKTIIICKERNCKSHFVKCNIDYMELLFYLPVEDVEEQCTVC